MCRNVLNSMSHVQRFFGTAVGKGRQGAKTDIERLDLQELTCKAAVKEIAKMSVSA